MAKLTDLPNELLHNILSRNIVNEAVASNNRAPWRQKNAVCRKFLAAADKAFASVDVVHVNVYWDRCVIENVLNHGGELDNFLATRSILIVTKWSPDRQHPRPVQAWQDQYSFEELLDRLGMVKTVKILFGDAVPDDQPYLSFFQNSVFNMAHVLREKLIEGVEIIVDDRDGTIQTFDEW